MLYAMDSKDRETVFLLLFFPIKVPILLFLSVYKSLLLPFLLSLILFFLLFICLTSPVNFPCVYNTVFIFMASTIKCGLIMQKDKTDTQTNGYFNSILNNNP